MFFSVMNWVHQVCTCTWTSCRLMNWTPRCRCGFSYHQPKPTLNWTVDSLVGQLPSLSTPMLLGQLVVAAQCWPLHIWWPPKGWPGWYQVQRRTLWLTKWWSDTMWFFFFCLNSHIMGITDSSTCKCFDMSTHMPKSKLQETLWVHFSSTQILYPPAAYSPPNTNWPVSLTQTQIGFSLTIIHLQASTQN